MLPETVFIIHNIQYSGKLYKKSNVVGCEEHVAFYNAGISELRYYEPEFL